MIGSVSRDSLTLASDIDVVGAARCGSAAAFETLMLRHYPRIYAYLVYLVHDQELADELAQDVFVTVHQKLYQLSEDRSFDAWLYRIARNHAVSHLRRKRLVHTVSLDRIRLQLPLRGVMANQPQPEDFDLRDLIQETLEVLSTSERDAMLLHTVGGFTTEEVAAILGISASAAGRRISRGKVHFRRAYSTLADSDPPKRTHDRHD